MDHALHIREHLLLLVLTDEVALFQRLLDLLADHFEITEILGFGLN